MLAQPTAVEMAVCNLGPWPVYQPLFDELDLLSLFDQHLPRAPQQEYSHGQVLQLLLHARLSHPQCTPFKIHQQIATLMGKKAVKSFFTCDIVPLTSEEQAALPLPKKGHQRAGHRLVWGFDDAAAQAEERYDGIAALVTTAPLT